jgi:hypothetical protein
LRLWSLHPQYLDSKGLVALWREALLAQAVLSGLTRGYTHHPQLERFREQPDPRTTVAAYLRDVAGEAQRRGYRFDRTKITADGDAAQVSVSSGQLTYEWQHLLSKLILRDPGRHATFVKLEIPDPHPLFVVVSGPVAPWERNDSQAARSSR